MSIPPAIRAGIAAVGFTACRYCGPVEVIPDEVRECPRICHAYAGCPLCLHPDSAEAVEMAWSVDDEIAAAAQLGAGQYLEPLPEHRWTTA